MTSCPRCGGEVPYSAVECGLCGHQVAAAIAPAAAQQVEEPPPAAHMASPAAPGATVASSASPSNGNTKSAGGTKLMAISIAIVGGGSVMLGLLIASSDTPKSGTAATSVQTRRLVQTPPVVTEVKPAVRPRWNSTNRDWIGNQRKAIAFELPAENKVAIWQRNVQPTLVVRCVANRIDAFVYTQSAVKLEPQDDNHTVRLRFDDGPEVVERWPDSDEHDALFAPDGPAFARRLSLARTMRFGFTPHNASAVTADFNVAGLSEVIAPAAKQCGWTK